MSKVIMDRARGVTAGSYLTGEWKFQNLLGINISQSDAPLFILYD